MEASEKETTGPGSAIRSQSSEPGQLSDWEANVLI